MCYIGILLAATLVAFFAGLFPCPFGFVILGFAVPGRILQPGGMK